MATHPHRAKITQDKARNLKIRRYRSKKDIAYQNWLVWTLGSSIQILANTYAMRHTVNDWLKLYNERIKPNTIYIISIIRLYCAEHLTNTFIPYDVIYWAIDRGLLTKSYVAYKYYRLAFFLPLHQFHFINHVSGKAYSLTTRSQLLLSTYDRYLKEYIQPSQRNSLHSKQAPEPEQ